MEKMPPIGLSYCLQCRPLDSDSWISIDFFNSYDLALTHLASFMKLFSCPVRIVRCNLQIIF